MRSRYIVVKKIKSGTKLSESSKLYIQDIFFVITMIFLAFVLSDFVLDSLFFPFIAFNVGVGLYLVMQSKYNPGMKRYKSIYLYLISPLSIYLPISNISQKNKTKRMIEKVENENE